MTLQRTVNIIEFLDAVRDRYRTRIAVQEFAEGGLRTMTYEALARAAWQLPWALNLLAAALLLRGLPPIDAVAFALLGWAVLVYLGAVKFLAHDKRWV